MIALGGRFPSEEELMQMDRKKAKEMQESMQGPQNLQVADLGKVLYGFISALVGNKWADHEWRNGFSVEVVSPACLSVCLPAGLLACLFACLFARSGGCGWTH